MDRFIIEDLINKEEFHGMSQDNQECEEQLNKLWESSRNDKD